MSHILKKFPKDPPGPVVTKAEGVYLHTDDGRKLLDTTGGWTSCAALGYSHPVVLEAMREQMSKFTHVDYNIFTNPMLEELAELLLSQAPKGMNRVYFAGNGGSEAMEGALKLSYQLHYDAGKRDKQWYIGRDQSFYGSTMHCAVVSELPVLKMYEPLLPIQRALVPQHNPYLNMLPGESLDDYARRGAKDLEDKILEIGAHRVAGFVGETQLGSLVGDVPAAPGYWKYIREVCDRHDVHLILDEIYCGLGRSGKIYNISNDDVTPDFIVIGKNLGAGHAPISAVITDNRLESVVLGPHGSGRLNQGHTHQGYSLGAAAALAVQKIVHSPEMLAHINSLGAHMRGRLESELGNHPFFRNVRGRGLLFSIEYDCKDKNVFGLTLAKNLNEKHCVLINSKWHRVSFTPAYILSREQADFVLDGFVAEFKAIAETWPRD
ncbi:aspartate aminotransferase family protein [Magnetospirillum sp. SS-4]|uniref:aminotransferase family protein n=1 Tax=Magnetospirillum sp. SS-4 TaxID=2681465 RepID=UPI001384EB97|nr:aminotransferase class III-fold pyridoxal phosphate-dependent enzyme [Magnetospirillum sp. SS-4]CAA7614484.1 Adenosylmethionine-8-amino-7-oxononanoate aminotransferase [Magnetospirillum sp. SS-4]